MAQEKQHNVSVAIVSVIKSHTTPSVEGVVWLDRLQGLG